MAALLTRRRFTVDEYHQMAQAGIFSEDDRVELIKGEVVEMTPIGSSHAACVARLIALFTRAGSKGILWVQNPVHLSEHSEPEPDFALLQPRPDFYASGHPRPRDILLIIEVADASASYDRDVKIPIYAQAGIVEVWLIDLAKTCVEVYREPTSQGYERVQIVRRGERLTPQAFPQLEVTADEILG